jgi:hypothetical protein
MFMAVVFTVVKKWTHPCVCGQINGYAKRGRSLQMNTIQCSERKEIHATKWMTLEDAMLTETNQL